MSMTRRTPNDALRRAIDAGWRRVGASFEQLVGVFCRKETGTVRGGRVTSALIGASRPEQVEDCVGALANPDFTAEELAEIDTHARDAGINLWAASSERPGPARRKK